MEFFCLLERVKQANPCYDRLSPRDTGKMTGEYSPTATSAWERKRKMYNIIQIYSENAVGWNKESKSTNRILIAKATNWAVC